MRKHMLFLAAAAALLLAFSAGGEEQYYVRRVNLPEDFFLGMDHISHLPSPPGISS